MFQNPSASPCKITFGILHYYNPTTSSPSPSPDMAIFCGLNSNSSHCIASDIIWHGISLLPSCPKDPSHSPSYHQLQTTCCEVCNLSFIFDWQLPSLEARCIFLKLPTPSGIPNTKSTSFHRDISQMVRLLSFSLLASFMGGHISVPL